MNKTNKQIYISSGVMLFLGIALIIVFIQRHATDLEIKNIQNHISKSSSQKAMLDRKEKTLDAKSSIKENRKEKKQLFGTGRKIPSMSISFSNDLSIIIAPIDKGARIPLSKKDLYFYEKMLTPEACGEFIGVEMVGGDGKYLTLRDSAYQGVFYNRDESRMSVPPIGLDPSAESVNAPDIKISLIDLISRLKPNLNSHEMREAISNNGLRFRIRTNLPSNGEWTSVMSEWIEVDEIGRGNLMQYLDSE